MFENKKKVMKVCFVYLLAGSLFFFSCRDDKGLLPATAAIISLSECDTSGFYNDDITHIMASKCSTPGCHVAGFSSGDLTTYVGVKAKVDNGSMNRRTFTNKDMPPAGSPALTDIELKRLDCWMKKGAPNNSRSGVSDQATTCTTTISYSLNVAPILSANCSSSNACHGISSDNGDYTAYAGLKADADNGKLNNRVIVNNNAHNAPAFVPPLSSSDKDKINCWIQQSSPNN